MLNVEQAIREVGGVYQAVAGRPIQPGRSELPPEVDPMMHVETRYRHFKGLIDSYAPSAAAAAGVVSSGPSWAPPLDVIEHEREIRYEFDLPGITREQVSVTVSGEFLVVRGQRQSVRQQGGTSRHQERRFGPFQKIAMLPQRARRDSIEASLQQGVLVVIVQTDGTNGEATEVAIEVK